jgi:uroporphyrinogen III methyltransferase/synthase
MMNGPDISNLLNDTVVASIGPITSDTLVKYGVNPSVQAKEFTVDGLIEALVDYYDTVRSTELIP